MSNLDQYLSTHPEIGENFLSLNKGLIAEIQQRFTDYHEANDLFSRYLMCIVLKEILVVESAASKSLLQQELLDRGLDMGNGGSC